VAVMNGSTLYVLRADNGTVEWSRTVVGAPGAGPALSEEFVFAPMLAGQVEVYDIAKPRRPPSVYRSFGRLFVQPLVSLNSVAWPTDEGNLYVGFAHVPGLRFRVEAKDAITDQPSFLAPDKVFFTSLDGYIYCLHEEKGHVLWRFTTGEPISHGPVALGDTVYAISDRGNMFAVSVATAQEKWLASGIRRYVAGNENRLYCLDLGGNLAILDARSGSRIGTIASGGIDLPFVNAQTDRIILANSGGLVQCLRESDLHWPVVHLLADPKKKKPAQGGVPAAGPPAAAPAGPPPVDPFAAPPADPFAAPPADPFAAPAAPMPSAPAPVDPFAPTP
jgi:outer membrane protein assembly factor BamB